MKHPKHAKLVELKAVISETSKEAEQKCPHCHLPKSKLSRHLKTCTSRPELGSQAEVQAMVTDEALASGKSQAEDYQKKLESEKNKLSNTWKALTAAKEAVEKLRGELAEEGRSRKKLETMIQRMQVEPYSNIDDTVVTEILDVTS